MKRFILRFIATITYAIIIILFVACIVFGFLWAIDFFNIPTYIFVPIIAMLFLWCIYKEIFGGDSLKKEIFQMRISKDTREDLNRVAKHYNLSASATVDMLIAKETRLIDKQRKEDESNESM